MFRVHPTYDLQMNPNRDFTARAIRGGAPVLAAIALAAMPLRAQSAPAPDSLPPAERVAADPAHGFSSPYYLYAPPALRSDSALGRTRTILVLPNNTGIVDDDPAVHEARVRELAGLFRRTARREGVILLMPAFPRPKSRDGVYTHALDRDAMLSPEPALRRPDLQLAAMIDDACRRLAADGIAAEPRVLMHGHSAAGMFVSRFVMLHPERVKAASIGAPGAWPMAPVASHHGHALTYPAGVADMRAISGHVFDRAKAAEVPLFSSSARTTRTIRCRTTTATIPASGRRCCVSERRRWLAGPPRRRYTGRFSRAPSSAPIPAWRTTSHPRCGATSGHSSSRTSRANGRPYHPGASVRLDRVAENGKTRRARHPSAAPVVFSGDAQRPTWSAARGWSVRQPRSDGETMRASAGSACISSPDADRESGEARSAASG